MRIAGEAASPESSLKKMQDALDSANQAMRARLAQPDADSAAAVSPSMKRTAPSQTSTVRMNMGKRIMGGAAPMESQIQSAGSAHIDPSLLNSQCGTSDAPQPPHLSKLILSDWQPILFYLDSPGINAGRNGYYGQNGDLAPGSVFGLAGRCFGDAPGSVIVQLTGVARRGDNIATRVAVGNTYEAIIESWSNTRISARMPDGITGVPPGDLTITVRSANSELVSQPQTAHFWPRWEIVADDAKRYAQLVQCGETLPIEISACIAGVHQHTPRADFPVECGTNCTFKGQHQRIDPDDRQKNLDVKTPDIYRLNMPAWTIPA